MGTASELVAWAESQLGVTEDPPNSNHVRYWDDVGMAGAQGQPWCAAFVLAGLDLTSTVATTRSVYVPTITADYATMGELYHVSEAQPGDQVNYAIGDGHTGIVVDVDHHAHTVTAVEGNTSPGDDGSQDNGGGVYLRVRPWSVVVGVGRPQFDQEDAVADSDVIAEVSVPTGAWYQLQRDGGVRVVDDNRQPKDRVPFAVYEILANTGQVYRFGPALNNGVFSYPGLPATARQGDRYFVAIRTVDW